MKRLLSTLALALLFAAAVVRPAGAAILVHYDFADTNPAGSSADFVATGVVASKITDGDGALNFDSTLYGNAPGAGHVPPSVFKTYAELDLLVSSRPDLATSTDFYQFTVSAAPNFQLDLSEFSYDARRSITATTANVTFSLYASVDATFDESDFIGQNTLAGAGTGTVFHHNIQGVFSSVPPSLTFRLYLNDNGQLNGGVGARVNIDNVQLSGNVVPEPGTMCLWASLGSMGLGLSVLGRFRKSAKQA